MSGTFPPLSPSATHSEAVTSPLAAAPSPSRALVPLRSGSGSPQSTSLPLRQQSSSAGESMELAIVPYGSRGSAPSHPPHRRLPHLQRGRHLHPRPVTEGEHQQHSPGAPCMELAAPLALSVEVVCPHCGHLYETTVVDRSDEIDCMEQDDQPGGRGRVVARPVRTYSDSSSFGSVSSEGGEEENRPSASRRSQTRPLRIAPSGSTTLDVAPSEGHKSSGPLMIGTTNYFRALPPPPSALPLPSPSSESLVIAGPQTATALPYRRRWSEIAPASWRTSQEQSLEPSNAVGEGRVGFYAAVSPASRQMRTYPEVKRHSAQAAEEEEEERRRTEERRQRKRSRLPARSPPPPSSPPVAGGLFPVDGSGQQSVPSAEREVSLSLPTSSNLPQNEETEEVPVDASSGGEKDSAFDGYYKHYFKELKQLGRGTFGGVFLCRHVMCGLTLGDYALKKIPVGDNTAYLQDVLREVRILEEVTRHPNVVEYKHSWVEESQLADFGPPVRCLFILMEYASEGSLDAYLERYGTGLSNAAVWYFFLSAVAGTAHLHRKKILHRDLKPQNLLLASSKNAEGPPRVLVSDFGTAALLGDVAYLRTGGTGTLEYMAPELLETVSSPSTLMERYENQHTMASDVWSLGMVLHYLACSATLPTRDAEGRVVLGVRDRALPFPRPPEMIQLMEAMLQLDAARRPMCDAILKSIGVQNILRTFNQEDLSYWDLAPQMAQSGGGSSPSVGPLGRGMKEPRRGGGPAMLFRPPLPPPPPKEAGGPASPVRPPSGARPGPLPKRQGSADSTEEGLYSSRVELLSTANFGAHLGGGGGLPARGGGGGGGWHSPGPIQVLSLARPSSPLSPVQLQPPQKVGVDAEVQTDPVRILDDPMEI